MPAARTSEPHAFAPPRTARRLGALAIALTLGLSPSFVAAQTASGTALTPDAAETLLWSGPDAGETALAEQALRSAAQNGDLDAQRILGQHLLYGWVLEQDKAQGLEWLEKAVAAGQPAAASALGQVLLWGGPVAQDTARATALLGTAADAGDVTAQRILGEQLVTGATLPQDTARGLDLLERAVDAGDAEAQVTLGKLFFNGTGLEEDKNRARALFEAAAESGNGEGLADYGENLMWSLRAPAQAQAMLERAATLGATRAWVTLAEGAMYGYLGGGSASRAKFDGYAEKARAAGEDRIAVLEAQRKMWGISMRADGPGTLAGLRDAADNGNAAAARYLIELLRDGNDLNIKRDLAAAKEALDSYGALLGDTASAQYALTLRAAQARDPEAYAPVAQSFEDSADLKSDWFGQEIAKANPNVAYYILQKRLRAEGIYDGPLDGYATRDSIRAVYKACRRFETAPICRDGLLKPEILGALLAR